MFSTVGGYLECHGGLQYLGGYLEYRGENSVPWGNNMMHVGDIMSTVGGVGVLSTVGVSFFVI